MAGAKSGVRGSPALGLGVEWAGCGGFLRCKGRGLRVVGEEKIRGKIRDKVNQGVGKLSVAPVAADHALAYDVRHQAEIAIQFHNPHIVGKAGIVRQQIDQTVGKRRY